MDDLQKALLALENKTSPLDEVAERFLEIEGWEALLAQMEHYNEVCAYIKTFDCVCGYVYPSGAKIIRCPYHERGA